MEVASKAYYSGQGPVTGSYFPPGYPSIAPPRYPGIPSTGYPGNIPPMGYPGNIPLMYPGMWNPYFNIRAGIPPYPPHMQINPQQHQQQQVIHNKPGQNPNGMGNIVNNANKGETKSNPSENGKRTFENSQDPSQYSYGKRRKSEWEEDKTLPRNWKKRFFQVRHTGTSSGIATMFEFLSPTNEIFPSRTKMVKHLKEDGSYTQEEIEMAQYARMKNGVNQLRKKFMKTNFASKSSSFQVNWDKQLPPQDVENLDLNKQFAPQSNMEFNLGKQSTLQVNPQGNWSKQYASKAKEELNEYYNNDKGFDPPVKRNINVNKDTNPQVNAGFKKYKTLQEVNLGHHGTRKLDQKCSEWAADPSLPIGWKRRFYQNNNRKRKTGKETKYQYLSPNEEIITARCKVVEYMRRSGMYSEYEIARAKNERMPQNKSRMGNNDYNCKDATDGNDFGVFHDNFRNNITEQASNESTPNLINDTDDNLMNTTEDSTNNSYEEKYLSYKKITKDIFGAFSNYFVNNTDRPSDDSTNGLNLSSNDNNESTDSAYMSLIDDDNIKHSSDVSRQDDVSSNEIITETLDNNEGSLNNKSMSATEEDIGDSQKEAVYENHIMKSSGNLREDITNSFNDSHSNDTSEGSIYSLTHCKDVSYEYSSSSIESFVRDSNNDVTKVAFEKRHYDIPNNSGSLESSSNNINNTSYALLKDDLTNNDDESGCMNNTSKSADNFMSDTEEWDEETNNDFLNDTIVSSILYINRFMKGTAFEDSTNSFMSDAEEINVNDCNGNYIELKNAEMSRKQVQFWRSFNISLQRCPKSTSLTLSTPCNSSEESYEVSNDLNLSFEDSKTSKEPFALNVCIGNSEEYNNSNVSVKRLKNFEESHNVTGASKISEESNYTSASYEDLDDLNATCENSSVFSETSDENPVELNHDITNSYELTQFPKFIGPLVSMNIDDFSILSVLFAKDPNPSKSIMDDISEDMEIPPKDLKWIFIKLRDMFKTKKGQLVDPKPIEDLVELMKTTYGENSFSF